MAGRYPAVEGKLVVPLANETVLPGHSPSFDVSLRKNGLSRWHAAQSSRLVPDTNSSDPVARAVPPTQTKTMHIISVNKKCLKCTDRVLRIRTIALFLDSSAELFDLASRDLHLEIPVTVETVDS